MSKLSVTFFLVFCLYEKDRGQHPALVPDCWERQKHGGVVVVWIFVYCK